MYAFIDESGDLGVGNGSTAHFVIASITTDNPRRLEKIVKTLWNSAKKYHHHGELHANQVNDATRMKLLGQIADETLDNRLSIIRKAVISTPPQEQYYRAMAGHILSLPNATIIVIDRKDTDTSRSKIIKRLGLEAAFEGVRFIDSRTMKQLQAVDFVAWAALAKYEHGETKYIQLIQDSIVGELIT